MLLIILIHLLVVVLPYACRKRGAEVIHNGLIKDDLSKNFLKNYEERCSIVFGKKHQLLLKLKNFY